IDLMDRTAGHGDWVVLKPSVTQSSNCILPAYVVADAVASGYGAVIFANGDNVHTPSGSGAGFVVSACGTAYNANLDPLTDLPYTQPYPTFGSGSFPYPVHIPANYPGFNPATAPNGGAGFDKNLGGNELPNTPPFTVSGG